MQQRDASVKEIQKRCSGVAGFGACRRNPANPPGADDLPITQIFELDEAVQKQGMRGRTPLYTKSLDLMLEIFIVGSSEQAATTELYTEIANVKKALYGAAGAQLLPETVMYETGATRILRPPLGANSIGIGLKLRLLFPDDISKL